MKTAKLVLSIISMVNFVIMVFKALAMGYFGKGTGDVTAMANAGGGLILALFILVAGILGISTRESKVGGIITGSLYLFGGFLVIFTLKSVNEFTYWSLMSIAFGIVFLLGSIFMKGAEYFE